MFVQVVDALSKIPQPGTREMGCHVFIADVSADGVLLFPLSLTFLLSILLVLPPSRTSSSSPSSSCSSSPSYSSSPSSSTSSSYPLSSPFLSFSPLSSLCLAPPLPLSPLLSFSASSSPLFAPSSSSYSYIFIAIAQHIISNVNAGTTCEGGARAPESLDARLDFLVYVKDAQLRRMAAFTLTR